MYDNGVADGIEQGAEEKAKETARKMLTKDMDIKIISELTGLTIEQIKEIK